jgi:hypothetical protein
MLVCRSLRERRLALREIRCELRRFWREMKSPPNPGDPRMT